MSKEIAKRNFLYYDREKAADLHIKAGEEVEIADEDVETLQGYDVIEKRRPVASKAEPEVEKKAEAPKAEKKQAEQKKDTKAAPKKAKKK